MEKKKYNLLGPFLWMALRRFDTIRPENGHLGLATYGANSTYNARGAFLAS